ncbi:Urb2/Npa2 family-domain-containing protein [Pseudoneurospora amorphoporcata]|uniref:Urb2/Npa2 family-domain-containing protein n=1 Tax=Pseudoneurospora amorphoporcata TaxID=241081 RepID=A0AAN6NW22_9PEZI|nr:Urb2/Npa2 family-domain-containing protein [Pseudoneurospora amorphoporcata]
MGVKNAEIRITGEVALIKTIRALDDGSADTIGQRLETVWNTLSKHRGGSFHAAEEMLLRWLLKNMSGSAAINDQVRRFPLSWNIMGAVFAWIPLFSLAKSLADRRFIAVLQQTLKDISTPQREAAQSKKGGSDVEMKDATSDETTHKSRKRKRTTAAKFDLTSQQQVAGCLQTAEAVFEALRILLSRCNIKSTDGLPSNRMGAEHIKSLFSSSASDVMQMLVPVLSTCNFAAESDELESSKEQSTWMSTFYTLWDLHLQGPEDASAVAVSLSGLGAHLLSKLTATPRHPSLTIDATVQDQWARDLRRFLTRNMILPARAAFLNNRAQDVIQVATQMSSDFASTNYPVLFDLVTRAPRVLSEKATKKDYEEWIQAVFDGILVALKGADASQSQPAVEAVLEMAADQQLPLSAESLRSVCKACGLQGDKLNWKLHLAIAKLNPDVFLVTQEGQALLDQALAHTFCTREKEAEKFDKATEFLIHLVNGHARARDLQGFIKTWLTYLDKNEPSGFPWTSSQLANAVAETAEQSLTVGQLVDILNWVDEQKTKQKGVKTVILAAIANGLSLEAYIDAANMRTFGIASSEKFEKKVKSVISTARWNVAEKAISRATVADAKSVWESVHSDVKSTLKRSETYSSEAFAAFKCCASAWVKLADDEDAASLTSSFVDKLDKNNDTKGAVSKSSYTTWILEGCPHLVSLLTKRQSAFPPTLINALTPSEKDESRTLDSVQALAQQILENQNIVGNEKVIGGLVDKTISLIETPKNPESLIVARGAIQLLLEVPMEAITRHQRESAMRRLVSQAKKVVDKPKHVDAQYWSLVLSLMTKLMSRPTFYEDMKFDDLETAGRCIRKIYKNSEEKGSTETILQEREDYRLLEAFATSTIRQMCVANPEEREKAYIANALTVLKSECEEAYIAPRLVLLRAFISVAKENEKTKGEADSFDLLSAVKPIIMSKKWRGKKLLPLLLALEATDVLEAKVVKKKFSSAVENLLKASNWLLEHGYQAGWEVRTFIAKHFREELGAPLKIATDAQPVADDSDEEGSASEKPGSVAAAFEKLSVLEYVDVVVNSVDQDTKLGYLKELLLEESETSCASSRLLIVERLIQHISGSRPPVREANDPSQGQFDLAHAHTVLCSRLSHTTASPAQFIQIAKIVHLLLDKKAQCMTQWNVDSTLSAVSAIASDVSSTTMLTTVPKTYESLCHLVEIVIKRHRKRLDGHFHILIPTLQSLLRRLISSSSSTSTNPSLLSDSTKEQHAKLLSRLLTLITEPTVASVSSRSAASKDVEHHNNHHSQQPLDSEKDKAKRYAGQHMYLVLMAYVKLQLEFVVPLVVREQLETGMFSIVDITPAEGELRIMNDGMDPSGRVIFREMYKRWERFGKWSGV